MRIAHPPSRSLIPNIVCFSKSTPLSLPFLPQKPQQQLPFIVKRTTTKRLLVTKAVAESSASAAAAAAAAMENEIFGFKRGEMYTSQLAGTMGDPYDRHVFLCYKEPASWLPKVEEMDFPRLIGSSFMPRRKELKLKTRVTVCEGHQGSDFEDGDMLIFPDMIKYKGLKEPDVKGFVDEVLVKAEPWSSREPEALTGSHIFVCAHGSRDKRCGVCGPVLIEKLREGIESRGLTNKVFVSACSHIGGHKYAGNLIVFNPNAEGKIIGHWYGYVTPEDVPEILDQHIGQGVVIERLLRGQMGVYPEVGEKVLEKVIPNGTDVDRSKKPKESKTVNADTATGCCQGANGSSCCMEVSDQKKRKEDIEVHGKKQAAKVSGWIGSLQQSDVLSAVSVVGALAVVAVAFSFYRRSL